MDVKIGDVGVNILVNLPVNLLVNLQENLIKTNNILIRYKIIY